MRPSPKCRMTELAITLSLGFALALYACAAAGASLIGEGLPTVTVPTVTVQAGPLVVETSPRPKVEVPGVATVETPSITPPQAVSPPVASPPLPTLSTPVSQPPGLPAASAGSTAGSHGTAGAQGGATAASAATAGPSQAGAATNRAAQSIGPAHGSSRPRATRRRDNHAATAGATSGRSAAGSPVARPTAFTTTTPARATAGGTTGKRSSGNPLSEIGRHIPFPVPVPDWSKPIILLLLALALWFAARSRLAGVRARRLEGQRASLVRDLGSMQATLVPVIPERLGELSISVAYRPAEGPPAGGDFYDVFALEPGKVAIVLGDIAGHGRDALNQAALTRYTLRAYLQAGLEPRAVLALAGSVLGEGAETPFATVVIGIHDAGTGRLTYASAGHPPPISIGFAASEPLTSCCSAPICCGLPTGRRQTTISVPAGGYVCFFSDGLLEARTAGGLLGRERLVEIVDELHAPRAAAALLQRVRAEALATPDDMVACVISPEVGAALPAAEVEELEVDVNTLAGPHIHTFLAACGVRAASVAGLLARARDVVDAGGTALLRIERPVAGGPATVAVSPGLATPASPAAIEQARRAGESALALPVAR